MGSYRYVVLTNPVAGKEDAFNEWYSNHHLKDLVAIPGFVAAQRFTVKDLGDGAAAKYKYLAIYEIEADDPKTAMGEMRSRNAAGKMVPTDTLDRSDVYAVLYEPFGPRAVEGKKT